MLNLDANTRRKALGLLAECRQLVSEAQVVAKCAADARLGEYVQHAKRTNTRPVPKKPANENEFWKRGTTAIITPGRVMFVGPPSGAMNKQPEATVFTHVPAGPQMADDDE